MTVPTPAAAEHDQQPVSALQSGSDASGDWTSNGDRQREEEGPRPLQSPSGPPALAGSTAPPAAFGNPAPALAPDLDQRDDDAGDELVRVPLARPPRARPTPEDPTARGPRTEDATDTTRPARTAEEQPPPPVATRRGGGDDTIPAPVRRAPDDQQAPGPGDGPAPSPLSAEEQRGSLSGRDLDTESPLRRPAPAPSGSPHDVGRDTEPHAMLGGREPTEQGRSGERASGEASATVQAPVQRDDSDPRLNDLFGRQGDAESGPPASAGGHEGDRVTNLTAPTLPAARRPLAPKPSSRPQVRTQAPGPTVQGPGASPGPTLAHAEPEPPTGNSVLRWLVVLLLIAAGAAVGIMLGQALI
jgi:hypothetical protein